MLEKHGNPRDIVGTHFSSPRVLPCKTKVFCHIWLSSIIEQESESGSDVCPSSIFENLRRRLRSSFFRLLNARFEVLRKDSHVYILFDIDFSTIYVCIRHLPSQHLFWLGSYPIRCNNTYDTGARTRRPGPLLHMAARGRHLSQYCIRSDKLPIGIIPWAD